MARRGTTSRSISSAAEIKKIGIVGAGTVGSSWAVRFLASGYEVYAFDRNPATKANILEMLKKTDNAYKRAGISSSFTSCSDRLSVSTTLEILADVDFIQESGPEDTHLKQKLYSEVESHTRPDVIISSSSSGLLPSELQKLATHPERILLGHPFNPPHIVPILELCGGKLTDPRYLEIAREFYEKIGMSVVMMRKEKMGHIANRFQAAILQEYLSLLNEGVASAEDLDKAMSDGPGLRWAIYGQFLNFDLGGGEGGIRHMFEHLGPSYLSYAKDLERLETWPSPLVNKVVAEVDTYLRKRNMSRVELASGRDAVLLNILAAKDKFLK